MRMLRHGILGAVVLLAASLAAGPRPAAAQDLQRYLDSYFTGSEIAYGSGSGVSSGSPRLELTVRYCASGVFYSSGRSCRPNLYASGFQCTPFEEAGQWRIVAHGNRAQLQWLTRSGTPGSIEIGVRNDGVVVDPRGNPFVQLGRVQC